jgi:phage gpG-like protein
VTTIEVHVQGADELVQKYRRISASIMGMLASTMKDQMTQLADYVRTTKLSGDPLHRRTGALSRAVTGDASAAGTIVIGRIGTSGIPYAYVHEYGGTFMIREHTRRVGYGAKEERIRLLTKQGKVRAAVKSMSRGIVRAHTATYPQRAFLHPSMEEQRDKIVSALRDTVLGALHAA